MVWTSRPVNQITGTLRATGDKSCSHRALILSGLATGTSEISGLLEGEDVAPGLALVSEHLEMFCVP